MGATWPHVHRAGGDLYVDTVMIVPARTNTIVHEIGRKICDFCVDTDLTKWQASCKHDSSCQHLVASCGLLQYIVATFVCKQCLESQAYVTTKTSGDSRSPCHPALPDEIARECTGTSLQPGGLALMPQKKLCGDLPNKTIPEREPVIDGRSSQSPFSRIMSGHSSPSCYFPRKAG